MTAVLLGAVLLMRPAIANDQQELVDRAKITVDAIRNDSNLGPPVNDLLAKAKGVLIFPNLFKAGFILGGEGGTGMLLVRGSDGTWSSPAFFSMGSGSIGLQIGAQSSEVIFLIMTDGGLRKVLNNSMKLGADASIAVGPVGAGIEASTTVNFRQDIYAYAKTSGLFGGGAFEGSVLTPREEWNRAYYGNGATTRSIAIDRQFVNYAADALKAALSPNP